MGSHVQDRQPKLQYKLHMTSKQMPMSQENNFANIHPNMDTIKTSSKRFKIFNLQTLYASSKNSARVANLHTLNRIDYNSAYRIFIITFDSWERHHTHYLKLYRRKRVLRVHELRLKSINDIIIIIDDSRYTIYLNEQRKVTEQLAYWSWGLIEWSLKILFYVNLHSCILLRSEEKWKRAKKKTMNISCTHIRSHVWRGKEQ